MSQEDLELKKYRLERSKMFFSVLTPIIVFGFGVAINGKLEGQKEALQEIQLRQQKIDLMQKIVPQLFDSNSNNNKSLAMMFLLQSVDSVMAESIETIFTKNFVALKEENDSVSSNSILKAAESYGGTFADTLKRINVKYKTADSLEKIGYAKLADKNVDGAIKYFSKADSAYPTFRQSYEITRYLNANKTELKSSDPDVWKNAFKTIATKYSLGMPKELKSRFLKDKKDL